MIAGITWLLACQLAGDGIVKVTHAPLPGPVVGIVVLLAVLAIRRPAEHDSVLRVADGLLRHLQLLFVPAGVGIVTYLGVLGRNALPIGVALVGSWLLGLLVVAFTSSYLTRRQVARA